MNQGIGRNLSRDHRMGDLPSRHEADQPSLDLEALKNDRQNHTEADQKAQPQLSVQRKNREPIHVEAETLNPWLPIQFGQLDIL